jgi:hypothetical protein
MNKDGEERVVKMSVKKLTVKKQMVKRQGISSEGGRDTRTSKQHI